MKLTSTLALLTFAVPAFSQTTPAVRHTTTATHRAATATRACNNPDIPALSPKIPVLAATAGCPKTLYSLHYTDTVIGTGPLAEPHKWYTVHYTGYLPDGTKFDSSVDRGEPITFPYGAHQVIPGWDTGFEGMHTGGKRRLFIPYQLAYGETGRPPTIPAKSELVFDIQLISFSDTAPKPKTPPTPPPSSQPAKPPTDPTKPADPNAQPAPSTTSPTAKPADPTKPTAVNPATPPSTTTSPTARPVDPSKPTTVNPATPPPVTTPPPPTN